MAKSLRTKLKDLIQEAEDSIYENQKVINLHEKGCKLPKYVEKVSDNGMKKAIVQLQNALLQLEETRNELKQLALAAVSQEQIVRMDNEFSSCLDDHKVGNERDLNLTELTSSDEEDNNLWARIMLAAFSLSDK